MRAALYQGKRRVDLVELPDPQAGPDDVVVQNVYASICGTDAAVWAHGPETGHRVTVGSEFGHEMVSRVVQAGSNVRDFAVGDVVYPYPRLAKGDPRHAGTVGAFSEYMLIPNAHLNEQLYRVPPRVPLRWAALIEPFTVGCRAARRAQPQTGENAVVFGAGTIGIAAAVALKYFGCTQVLICDRSELRLAKARNLGFATCNNGIDDLAACARDLFGIAPGLHGDAPDAPIYIDAAGADSIIADYQVMGCIGSRLVVVAVKAGLRPVDVLGMTYAQQALIGSGGYFPEDVRDVMAIMASGRWDVGSIVTHVLPWEQLPFALELAGHPDEALNVLIDYGCDSASRI